MDIKTELSRAINFYALIEYSRKRGFFNALLDIETTMVSMSMSLCKNNCTKAAKMMGVNRTTLVEKRRKLQMPLAESSRKKYGTLTQDAPNSII